MKTKYETEELLGEYLLFHYGDELDQMPFEFNLQRFLHFPVRCVSEFGFKGDSALDLGCAVGRSSFELSKAFAHVTGIDKSEHFIQAAKQIQTEGSISYKIKGEGIDLDNRIARLPQDVDPSKVSFHCIDAAEFKKDKYDLVLAANLICRLEKPATFLENVHSLVTPRGRLILITPYSWLPEFTSEKNALRSFSEIETLLKRHFQLEEIREMPFLLREHYRKYELSISQASVWKLIR